MVLSSFLIKTLAWTFIHSLWQGLLAALLAAIIIASTRRSTARLRYNLLGIVLVSFMAVTIITFSKEYRQASETVSTTFAGTSFIPVEFNTLEKTSPVTTVDFIADLSAWFNNYANLFMLAWVVFFSLHCLKLITGLSAVNRLRNYKIHPVPVEWLQKLDELRQKLSVQQPVIFLQSELAKVPMVMGILKPVILLPVGLITHIPPEQVETILLHELAHIRRRDYLVNLFQHVVEAFFFFNPAILWISSLVRQEREACCDDIAVAYSRQKKDYLDALVAFQEYTDHASPYSVAIRTRKGYLLNRVKRIVTKENKRLNVMEKAGLLAGMIIFSAFTFITQEKEVGAMMNAIVEPFKSEQQSSEVFNHPAVDTIPVKKRIIERATDRKPVKTPRTNTNRVPDQPPRSNKPAGKNDRLPANEQWEKASKADPQQKHKNNQGLADEQKKLLFEIQAIKDQIGIQKESIGKKKELLGTVKGKDKKRERELQKEIDKERDEVEVKREELERKRDQLEQLRIQQDKLKGENLKPAGGKLQYDLKQKPNVNVSKSYEPHHDLKDDKKLFLNNDDKNLFLKKDRKLGGPPRVGSEGHTSGYRDIKSQIKSRRVSYEPKIPQSRRTETR